MLVERSEPWRLLAAARPDADARRETHLMAAIAWTTATPVDTVIMVGGSSTREFPANDAHLSGLLTQRCGRPIHFVNAGTSAQTLAESWALAEAIPDDRRRLVVVGMNYSRFEEGAAQVAREMRAPLLPLHPPPALQRAVGEVVHPATVEGPALSQTSWLVRRLGQVTWRENPETFAEFARSGEARPWNGPQNLYRAPGLDRARKAAIVRRMMAERLPLLQARRGEALALWRAFLNRFDGRGAEVLFIALPESPSMAPMNARAGAGFADDLSSLQRDGARIADWRTDHGLTEHDFYDQQHLLETGRRRVEPRFVDLLVDSLPDCRR
jgi:hypothetical protein